MQTRSKVSSLDGEKRLISRSSCVRLRIADVGGSEHRMPNIAHKLDPISHCHYAFRKLSGIGCRWCGRWKDG